MHFVDDIYLVAPRDRHVLRAFKQLAHFIDLGIGRRINLQQIDKASRVNLSACRAHAARFGGYSAIAVHSLAIERLRKNARQRRLADASCSGKKISVMYTAGIQCVGESRDHMVLSDNLGKRLRTPLAGKNLMTHRTPMKCLAVEKLEWRA